MLHALRIRVYKIKIKILTRESFNYTLLYSFLRLLSNKQIHQTTKKITFITCAKYRRFLENVIIHIIVALLPINDCSACKIHVT